VANQPRDAKMEGVRRTSLPYIAPMLASPGPPPSDLSAMAAEPKWDGARASFSFDGGALVVETRSRRDVTACFPELAPMAEAFVGRSVVLDGELVVAGEGGRPDFYALSTRLAASRDLTIQRLRRSAPATFVAFDLLWLDGQLTTPLPYVERRRLLEALQLVGPAWQTTPSYPGDGAELFSACASLRLEGCLYKDLEAPYRPGIRCRRAWIKQKCPAWVAEHAPRRRPGRGGQERASAAGRP
jgi:bifunctional non-homologous end joining protein LigD